MTLSDEFLRKFNEVHTPDPNLDQPVDQKWLVKFKRVQGTKGGQESVADALIVRAPNESAAESIVKRMVSVDSITSVAKYKDPDVEKSGMTNDLFGFEWGNS